MTRQTISNAVTDIDERFIFEASAHTSSRMPRFLKRFTALAAALLLAVTLAVPVMAGADIEPAYQLLYSISPKAAQELKPVRMSCVSNGIRMEVISAKISGDSAKIYISMQDLTGSRIDETTDLFDSYSINRPFSCSATCSRLEYDPAAKIATFLIHITQANEKAISGNKITFSVGQLLTNKHTFEGPLSQVDLGNISTSPAVQTDVRIRGSSWNSQSSQPEEYTSFLVPSDAPFTPTPGVAITATGIVDGKFHVQACYENILETDNHGSVSLKTADGNEIFCSAAIAFWDEDKRDSYEEYIFDITTLDLSACTLNGYFQTCDPAITGDWQVTFPLE